MRVLAIDLGERRTGLAMGDDQTEIVTPAGTIEAVQPAQLLRLIVNAVKEHQPDALVVGLPLNMDGSEGAGAKKTRALAGQVGKVTGLQVYLVDERLTSTAADEAMSQSGLTHKAKKGRRDALAAAEILRRFFAEQ